MLYVSSENWFKSSLTSDECRWCTPPGVDTRIQRQLVWNDPVTADHYSNLTGHLATPLFTIGTLALSSLGNRSWRRWFDDTLPVLEAVVITNLITQVVKFSAARQRPFVYVGGPAVQPEGDLNTSFVSGHASLGFALAASAGTVATLRGYRTAPYIWAGGMALAVTTSYLRMAADAHYFTDVFVGGLIGAGVGLAVPLLLHREVLAPRAVSSRLLVIPRGSRGSLGLSVAGEF